MPRKWDGQINEELARFKGYLEALTDVWIDPRLRARFGFSDVVQATLLKAFESIDKLRGMDETGQKRYLSQMLENKLIDLVRHETAEKRDRRRERSLEEAAANSSRRLSASLAAEGSAPDARLIREERAAALLAALSQLPAREREALILQKFHGWKLAEIAAHLGCTSNAVAGLHAHGLKRLGRLLEPRKEGLDD
jgi:RNA polymerase sigma-70 factor (subfamily 1)